MTGTSLALQASLRSAAALAGLGGPARSLAGLSASAKGFAAAAAATEAPVVVIVPGAADVEQMVADASFFLGSLTAAMLPYSLWLLVAGVLLTVVWALSGIPPGPGAGAGFSFPV